MRSLSLEAQVEKKFGLRNVACKFLNTPTNDVFAVTTHDGRFALKLYNAGSRVLSDVEWEVDLTLHLINNDVAVVRPVPGRGDYVQVVSVDGVDRLGVLFEWAPGEKPLPSSETYALLGASAAHVHRAADSFARPRGREGFDVETLIDEQLTRMQGHLVAVGRWAQMVQLVEGLKAAVADPSLDRGVCHMDLTPDNVHCLDGRMTVFDFDSAGECWRSLEPHHVLRRSPDYFKAWLDGYRSVREFSVQNERAVSAFTVIGDLRCVAWDLGVAKSSRGEPLLDADGLVAVVDRWLAWEDVGS